MQRYTSQSKGHLSEGTRRVDVDTLINSLYTPPEPDSRALSLEGEYDEPMPENYRDLMQKLEQGIDFLVEALRYEFRPSDYELNSMLTHILNDPNPANHSDDLRALLDWDTINDVVERIEYLQLDNDELINYAMQFDPVEEALKNSLRQLYA